MSETWKPVVNFEELYEVSSHGRVRSLGRVTIQKNGRIRQLSPRILKPIHFGTGYAKVNLYGRGHNGGAQRLIHHLVLEAFVGPCPEGMECRHVDGSPPNNRLDNLSWGTHVENEADKRRHGTAW